MGVKKPSSAKIEIISLQSGSDGNSYYIEAGGVSILIDAGISGRQAEQRLRNLGKEIRRCKCLFISHDHRDHTQCMGVYHRKFGLPIALTRATYHEIVRHHRPGPLDMSRVHFFGNGCTVQLPAAHAPLQVHSVPTPHDGADCLAFVIEYDGRRVGILSDLGHPFPQLAKLTRSLDAMVIESNYDPDMLQRGPYPESLQARIRGSGGHLSNEESAELVCQGAAGNRLQWAVLCHLSRENNTPRIALDTHRAIVPRHVPLQVADRRQASGPWFV